MQQAVAARQEMDPKYTWRLTDIYESDEAFEKDFEALPDHIEKVEKKRGTCANGAADFYEALQANTDAEYALTKLFVYARMKRDEDNGAEKYQGYVERVSGAAVQLSSAAAYLTPEILAMEEETLARFVQEEERLGVYARFLHEISRQRAHILSPEEEQVLALSGDMAGTADLAYTMLTDLDMQFADAEDGEGKKVPVTRGRYRSVMENPDRVLRENAFSSFYQTFGENINTLAALLGGSMKKDLFYARARKYDSVLAMHLADDNVPEKVYDTLIDTTQKHLSALHRYIDFRKRVLGVDALHFYDLYVPLFAFSKEDIPYESAQQMVFESIRPMGKGYTDAFQEALRGGWIDVYENKGKSSGAYSWGVYGVHPFVLLNYSGGLDDVFTLAHEMGHAMHSYYSQKHQPYQTSDYSIFVAEVASTVNEWLLLTHLLETTKDARQRAALLNMRLEMIRTTAMRQTQFARFEKEAHALAAKGEALTAGAFSGLYGGILAEYYGDGIVQDPQIQNEWAIVPHFYRAFYVYQYATGLSAAAALAEKIIQEGPESYLAFLSSGSSDDVLKLLQRAGVDLTTAGPTERLVQIFEETLAELEALCEKEGWIQ